MEPNESNESPNMTSGAQTIFQSPPNRIQRRMSMDGYQQSPTVQTAHDQLASMTNRRMSISDFRSTPVAAMGQAVQMELNPNQSRNFQQIVHSWPAPPFKIRGRRPSVDAKKMKTIMEQPNEM